MLFHPDKTQLHEDSRHSNLLSDGQTFGHFRVIRLLGRGGMGEVYEVEHRDLSTRHALKLINPEIVDRPDAKERFKREARVMARLRHSNIVHVDDFGELDGHIWLRMDLMNGWAYQGKTYQSLQELMRDKGALPESLVRRLLGSILDGLGFAHDSGAVHRDLKPANLLLDEQGNVKITDFGLVSLAGADWLQSQVQLTVARSMADPDATHLEGGAESAGTSTQALLGTYAYMSPEQKKGDDVDHRSDLYSVGLIGFQLLTGEETAAFETPTDLVEGVDPMWDNWVKKALASQAGRRFESAAVMSQVLNDEAAGDVAGARDTRAPSAKVAPTSSRDLDVIENREPEILVERESITAPPLEAEGFVLKLADEVYLEMVWVAPGQFTMGSPQEVKEDGFLGFGGRIIQAGERGRSADERPHVVTLSQGYWLGATAVTQGQWQNVMGSNCSRFKGSNLPVEKVSWKDAMAFCGKFTERERAAGRLAAGYEYSLPSEAQWEYACRAGTTGAAAGLLGSMAVYYENSSQTHVVGSKRANAWGLYDMHGNVWEWCNDRYGNYPIGSAVFLPVSTSTSRVIRGGCWRSMAKYCRSASRSGCEPDYRDDDLGFRLALRPVQD